MCGRIVQEPDVVDLKQEYAVDLVEDVATYARYNIGPTSRICIINNENNERVAKMMRWGIIPAWVKDVDTYKWVCFNARSETIETKPLFNRLFQAKRCIIVVSGYYEWKALGPHNQKGPYYFKPKYGKTMALAGLWDRNTSGGKVTESCVIITCEPNEVTMEIHDRMPVILDQHNYDKWLDPLTPEPELKGMLKPCSEEYLEFYPVDRAVGNVRNDDPHNIEPVELPF